MKLKLVVSNERYEGIKAELSERGIEIDDNADLVLRSCIHKRKNDKIGI